jgi:hypothetical protein
VRFASAALLTSALFLTSLGFSEDDSFHVKVPDQKGRQTKAQLTLSDHDKAVEVRPVKGDAVSIPYAEIDKFSYEYTKKHRITDGTIITAPIGVGAVLMLTKYKSHWLEIDYHDQELPKAYVVRMEKHDYIHILDAVKNHTGKDTEIVGNADKRKK